MKAETCLIPAAEAPIHTVDGEDPMELTLTSMEPIAACMAYDNREKPTSTASTNKANVENVACGSLLLNHFSMRSENRSKS